MPISRSALGATTASVAIIAAFLAHSQPATAEPERATSVFELGADVAIKGEIFASESAALSQTARDIGLSADEALSLRSVTLDADGTRHLRLDRTFRGLPVFGGDLIVRRAPHGAVAEVIWNGGGVGSVASIAPALDALEAREAGRVQDVTGAQVAPGELIVYSQDGPARLAYRVVTVGVQHGGPVQIHRIVDAHTGETLDEYSALQAAKGHGFRVGQVEIETTSAGGKYVLKDKAGNQVLDARNGGNLRAAVPMTDDDNVWGDGTMKDRNTVGVDASYGMTKTFDFFKKSLGRDGVWDNGRPATTYTHFENNLTNAYWSWDDQVLTLGSGKGNAKPLTAVDVVGHEVSHGVTQNTAGLVYRGEPGGLNESASDIFGAAIEFSANTPSDVADYHIGELVDFNGDGKPLRYMDKPSRDGKSPDCYSRGLGNINVHLSSGPMNHWYYLAAEGSGAKTINGIAYDSPTCGDAPAVRGAGRDAATKIFYRALSTKFTSNTGYAGAREGLIASAKELYGKNSAECVATVAALNAIAVPVGSQTCGDTDTPTPTPTTTTTRPTVTPTTTRPTPTVTTTATTSPTVAPTTTATTTATTSPTLTPTVTATPTATDTVAPVPAIDFELGGAKPIDSKQIRRQLVDGTLAFDLSVATEETSKEAKYDTLVVRVNGMVRASFSNLDASRGTIPVRINLPELKGQRVYVEFMAVNDDKAPSTFTVRGVALR